MLFTGRLTANAEVNAVKGDKQVINFTVAINQKWKNKAGEKKEKTAFVDCAYWRNSGIAEYLTKGAVVEISGWMEVQGYQSKKDGIHARLICTCDTIKLFSLVAKANDPTDSPEKRAVTAGANSNDDEAGISYYRDEDTYMYYNYEALEDWISDDWCDGEENDYAQEKTDLENARTQGDFIQAKMMKTGFRQSLDSLIANFKAGNKYEKDCLEIARTCLQLEKDFPNANLFQHASMQDYEVEDYEDNYVGMHEYISFVGSINDHLSERLKSMVNDDFNERCRYQEPEVITFFNEARTSYTDKLGYEQRAFRLIDDLCTLLYRRP